MERLNFSVIAVFAAAALLLPAFSYGAVVGTASMEAPAVIIQNNTGSMTLINLTVTNGDGTVLITGPATIGNSTTASAQVAAQYASAYLGLNRSKYNFTYSIGQVGGNVSGPSAGAAMAVLAISALSGRHLVPNFTMTGTISPNGTIGQIGGVYDKVSAAKSAGLRFVLVPYVGSSGIYAALYALVQDTYNIPLVQVANISQAISFAINGIDPVPFKTNFSAYTPIALGSIPSAPIACSNNCSMAQFGDLANMTITLTRGEVNNLAQNQNFNDVYSQLNASLTQAAAISGKGYLYAGSNFAFLTYLYAFYFNNYLVTKPSGLSAVRAITRQCYSLSPPALTAKNYEFVLGGELRQAWGENTANETITFYNSSIETTDDILFAIYRISEARGWCSASSWMYNISLSDNGAYVTPSANLSGVASSRIARAAQYGPSQYLTTAEQAMEVQNYPLAILDADYGYALGNATASYNLSVPKLTAMADGLARNSTFGVWATQFANEAVMYSDAAKATANKTDARSFADSAYSAALLASQFSSDMRLINSSLTPGYSQQRINSLSAPRGLVNGTASTPQNTTNAGSNFILQTLSTITNALNSLYNFVIVLIVINVVLLAVIIYLVLAPHKAARDQLYRRQKPPSRRPK